MGMSRRRTVFEQPVIVLNIVSNFFLVGSLGVLSWATVTSSQDVTSGQPQQQEGGGGVQQHLPHHRPLCPEGWVRGSTGGQSFKDKDAGLCLYLSPQALPWPEARKACRATDSLLLSLDTVVSVEDRLFPQYLKDKGVSEVWTSMYKDGGRQIWDEPGKGMVKAYRGSQRSLGEAKRGWTWDAGSFSDARMTCGLYAHSSDQPHSSLRRRRDADTPSPGAAPHGSSDSPGREDSHRQNAQGLRGGGMGAFKTFLSNQGMKTFASKMSENPAGKLRGGPSAKLKTVAQARKRDGSTHRPEHYTSAGKTHDSPSGKDMAGSSEKKHDFNSDKYGSGLKDKDNNNNDSPYDDKNGMEKSGNNTSDEDDNNHELVKRSTPSMFANTTPKPGDFSNVTKPTNASQKIELVTPPSSTNLTDDSNSTESASISEDSSQSNETSSTGLFGQDTRILDFFNTDSKDTASAGTQPAFRLKTDVPSDSSPSRDSPPRDSPSRDSPPRDSPSRDSPPRDSPPRDSPPRDSPPRDSPPREQAPRPLTPQEFIQRFQTGIRKKLNAAGDSSANATQTANDNGQAQTNGGAGSTSKSPTAAVNAQQNAQTQSNAQAQEQLFGNMAASGSKDTTTQPPSAPSTTPDSSSEEHTDSSVEATTTPSTLSGNQGTNLGLFSDSGPALNSATTFQQHFGPSSADGSSASGKSDVFPTTQQSSGSAEGTTTPSTHSRTKSVDLSDELFKNTDVLTLPSYAFTRPAGASVTTTAQPADSGESTPQTDSGEVTSKPDSAEVTTPRSGFTKATSAKDSQEVTPQPDSAEVPTHADSAPTDSKEVTPSPPPGSREVTPATDSQEVTSSLLDSQEVTQPPSSDSKEVSADSKEVTVSPTQSSTPSPTSSADSSEEQTTASPGSQEDLSSLSKTTASTNSGLRDQTTTARLAESSEELDHVTGASTAHSLSDVSGSKEGTTYSQLKGILASMTPRPDHVTPSAGLSLMTLQYCQQRHQFVCAAKPVHDFTTLTQCGDGWLGHSLVSRCYRLVSEPAPYEQAQRQCQNLGGVLASVDTAFFANVTHLLLDRMSLLRGLASRVWIEGPVRLQDRLCSTMEPQVPGLQSEACDASLPYFCQKDASRPTETSVEDDENPELDKPSMIMNMSSWNTQPIVCPVRPVGHHDVVIWFKDGQPIPSDSDDTSTVIPHSTNSRNPALLHLNANLLQRLGVTQRRMQQPALLQGMYWCRVWRHHPLRSVTSDPVYVRFQDVVTLQGFIKTSDVSVMESAFFNEMRDNSGLPAAIGRGLQLMNDRIYPRMQRSQPFLSDIITIIQNANAETNEVEFRTYLCLSTGAMAPQDKGAVVDAYLKVLHTELVASEDLVRRDWNLSVPVEQAFRLLMTEMCPESRLVDESTGYEATFPSTPVNQHAVSLDGCDGMFTGYAVCRGDLMSGAYWSHWSVDMTCYDSDRTDTAEDDHHNKDNRGGKPKINPEDVVDTGQGFVVPSKPNADLLDIDEVHIEQENVEDVTDRLEDILDTSVELTDVDVEIVADVIDRVSLVPILPQDVGLTLLKTVNRVLDSPLPTLQVAQRRSQASTRILQDLDKFSEKLDFGHRGHVRYVTPNVAMEVWNTRTAREPVIGLAAIRGQQGDSPLSDTRIMTLSNRTWADLHLGALDVAIELPDQLVSGDGVGSGRLSMAIYRKPGLFLSSLAAKMDSGDVVVPDLNSAIISATLASTTVKNLKESVKLIFRPLKASAGQPTRCVYWDFSLPSGGGWSSQGCVHNGTVQGRDICLCNHLTNFAVLLDFYGDDRPVDEANTTALSVITIVGLSLSILGLALTVITFIFFKKLRQGRAQQTLFHMSIALLCSEVVLLTGLKQTANYGVCLAVAVLLHYFILASFLWMLVEAVLQYLTFVKVLGTYISKYTLKTVVPAWTIPLIPVIAVLATDYTQYRGRRDYCWMNLDAFYYAFALPVGVIILFNIVTFIVIMLSLLRRPEGLRSTRNKGNTAETNIKAAFTIFVLLGLTWTFGYLAIADARLPFQYMFTIFSSLQGFLIFVLLVARRRQFREQWRALCCRRVSQARGQKITPTLSNSASSQSSTSSFTSSSRSRTSSEGSSKTLDILIKRADSNASRSKVQLSSKASTASTRSRQC